MISLKLTNISVTKQQDIALDNGYLYKDLDLDLKPSFYYVGQLNRSVPLKDVQALYDLEAVKNSIRTCFLTSPGQKILSPEYGIDLRRYLFEPVSNDTTFFIADDISTMLPRLEPRIEVINVSVVANPDEQQYDVILQINVPSLNIFGVSLKNTLNSNGYF